LRTVLRAILWIAGIVFVVFGAAVWWLVYRPLPQLDGSIGVPGLQNQVTVDRDIWGVPHIRASSAEDMAEAQGFVAAQDRLWQMDLLRRVGRGELSEILGPATLDIDRDFRTMNFSRTAERETQLMDPELYRIVDAYARGVNRFIEQHSSNLPLEFTLLNYRPEPWKVSDTLIIIAYMYRTLTDTRHTELHRAAVLAKVSPELAKDLYSDESAMDRFVVGDPNVDKNPHVISQGDSDEDDDDEMDYDDVLKAGRNLNDLPPAASTIAPDVTSALAVRVRGWLRDDQGDIRRMMGSNNWVVSGAHTATGKPLLANDMHLELNIPPIWYETHLTAPGWNVKGFSLPGTPGVVVGHNDRIAWGFTNNGADVLDLYIEAFNSASPDEYKVNGQWRKADVHDEVIHVKGAQDERFKVVVTRHGPVVHRDGDKVYAMRWTALEPGGLANSYSWLGRAQNWKEFREALSHVWGPGQNVVYADVDGNIGYALAARVPIRKKGRGTVPVPGDTDEYEWTGYIPFEDMPKSFNPESGLIVTANARVTGPDYKPYLTDDWEEPYRTARIFDLLHEKHDLRPEDMLKVQTDTYSYPHVFIAEQLVSAVNIAPPKDARTKKLIDEAKQWNGIADVNSTVVPFLDAAMYRTLDLMLEPYLGKETELYDWRRIAFLQRILSERPARWLPAGYKNYDELLSAAADQAVKKLQEKTQDPNPEDWVWKRFNYLDMLHPIGRQGILKRLLSLSDEPQSGTLFSPRAASRHHGPSERFVGNLADWDQSIMLIPAGQSGQPGSEHYRDQFPYWFDGKAIYGPFTDSAEAKTRKHTLVLKPSN
jgi:penicillin G amidase